MVADEEKVMDNHTGEPVMEDGKAAVAECADMFLIAHRLLLTSLGAIAITAEDARDFINRLVERGEAAESDVQKWVEDLQARGQAHSAELQQIHQNALKKTNVVVEEQVETILGRLNVPTRNDIEELSEKISALAQKVSALQAKRKGASTHAN